MITLLTKDGRKYGNAIIYGGAYDHELSQALYYIETDFGNRMVMTWTEVTDGYHIGPVRKYSEWDQARSELRSVSHSINPRHDVISLSEGVSVEPMESEEFGAAHFFRGASNRGVSFTD